MSGTTLCKHCDTRFKVAEEQLESHSGMVRCGNCLQAFDARPSFIPDQPSPQLELPMLDEPITPVEKLPADGQQAAEIAGVIGATELIEKIILTEQSASTEKTNFDEVPPPGNEGTVEIGVPETIHDESIHDEITHNDLLNFNQPAAIETHDSAPHIDAELEMQPMTLAEQVAIVQDEDEDGVALPPAHRRWPWVTASVLLFFVLFAQAVYFFRVELSARLPGLKPALTAYCQILKCKVPLPQNTNLMGIESSDLEADPAQENQFILTVLLRNRATYAQAFPNLELTLNDTQDRPLARRIFVPKDYLPPVENEKTGLLANHEFSVKLHLGSADLNPSGYRLALHYPRQ
jgi:predicted Zn finger-like uncharacterized protein